MSLEKQTMDRSCFEIIVVLNGENGPYLSLIHNYIEKAGLDNVRIIYTEEKGVSNARNIGMDNSKGDFIVFLDDDDFLSSNYLNDLFQKVSCRQNTIVVSNVKTYSPVTQVEGLDYLSRAFKKSREGYFSVRHHRSFFSSVCAKIIPVHVIDKIRFNTNLSVSEDAVFMFAISKNIHQVYLSDKDSIYYRRLTAGSASRRKKDFVSKFKIMWFAIQSYSKVYFSECSSYRFSFYLNRMSAAIYSFLRSITKI